MGAGMGKRCKYTKFLLLLAASHQIIKPYLPFMNLQYSKYRLSPALLKSVWVYSLVNSRLGSVAGPSERGQKRKN